jgi:hypothetical protein
MRRVCFLFDTPFVIFMSWLYKGSSREKAEQFKRRSLLALTTYIVGLGYHYVQLDDSKPEDAKQHVKNQASSHPARRKKSSPLFPCFLVCV